MENEIWIIQRQTPNGLYRYLSTSIRLIPLKVVYRIVLIVFRPRSACAYLYTIWCVSQNNENVIVS